MTQMRHAKNQGKLQPANKIQLKKEQKQSQVTQAKQNKTKNENKKKHGATILGGEG